MMTLQEFIGYFKMAKDKKAECEKHVVKKYISFAEKLAKCTSLAQSTNEVKLNPNTAAIHMQNTPSRYLCFTINLIKSYTDIVIPEETIVEAYDQLKESGAFDVLMMVLPQDDVKEYSTILTMCVDDYLANNRDLVSYFENRITEMAQMATSQNEDKIEDATAD